MPLVVSLVGKSIALVLSETVYALKMVGITSHQRSFGESVGEICHIIALGECPRLTDDSGTRDALKE
jgi:hypothetical protein